MRRIPPLYQLLTLTITISINRIDSERIPCSSHSCRCVENDPCFIDCIGEDACKGDHVTLTCKSGFDCTVTCKSNAACMDATIDASHAVDVSVVCNGKDACKGSGDITCGSGDCLLTCGGTRTACQDTQVNTNDARSFQCVSGVHACDHQTIPNNYTPNPTESPTKFPSNAPTNAPSNAPSNSPTKLAEYLYDVVSFGFRGSITDNSSVLLTLWFDGGMYKCEVDDEDTSPFSCVGSESWVDDLCYVNEGRSQILIQTDNNTELTVEDVFVNATSGLDYSVHEFCLFDADLYREYRNITFTQFYYGSQGTDDCLRDEPSSQELILRHTQSVIISIENGLVEDGIYIDDECKRNCCGNEQDVITMKGLIGWYKAVHFDQSLIVWSDASTARDDVTASDIEGGSITVASDGESTQYVVMDGSTKIIFPQTFDDYTLFFVNRGGTFSTDCSSHTRDIGVDTAWNVNTHNTTVHRSNGVMVRNAGRDGLSGSLCIEARTSDLNLKELIVYDRSLSDADIECIESYLGSKYGVELTTNIEFSSNTESCVEYQLIGDLVQNVDDAEDLCSLRYDAHLASVHSLFDYEHAFHLCKLESYRCFLGGTDYDGDCVWEWMDGTAFNWNEWQTGEGCNRPQNNICIFPMLWDEVGFRDCSGSGAGYAICDRLMEAASIHYLSKTYLNVIFKVCDVGSSRNLNEFTFELSVLFGRNETLIFGSSGAECFGLESNASEIIYCYFNHNEGINGDVTQLNLKSRNEELWCFDEIVIGVYDDVIPFDETQCPFNTNSSCDFWKLRSEALAADYYLSRFVPTKLSLHAYGNALTFSTINEEYTLLLPTKTPTEAPTLAPTTPKPTLPTDSPLPAPSAAPTVSNTHVWITFDVCNSLQNVYDQFDFGFALVGTAGATPTVDSKQHCIEDEYDYTRLDCFMHSVNFIGEFIELSIQPISGGDWCFDGVMVRVADIIAPKTSSADAKQELFSGDYMQSHFVETDLSNQVNEGVMLSSDCFHSFYERNDGDLIQCFDDLFTLYPYKPRQQIAIKLHTCSVRDSGMDPSSLEHMYLDIIGKDRNETDGDWISMEKPISLSHFPRHVLDSGKVHWENIGVLVASNVDIDIYKSTKVYFHSDIEGILIGIKYKVNALWITDWDENEREIAGEEGSKCGFAHKARQKCLADEKCDAYTDKRGSSGDNDYCLRQNVDQHPAQTDNGKDIFYKKRTPHTDSIPKIDHIWFKYDDRIDETHDKDTYPDERSRVYQTSEGGSTYIQLINDDKDPQDTDIYMRGDEPAEFSLNPDLDDEHDVVQSHMNIDIFYIIRECKWIKHDDKKLGEEITDSKDRQLCYPTRYEAKTKCIEVLKCSGIIFKPNNDNTNNQWCCRKEFDLEDEEGFYSLVKQCGGLNDEMPYVSIGSYLDMSRSGAVLLTTNEVQEFSEGKGRKTGIGWYNMEKRCRDEFSTELASIHSKAQNLAARLAKFERYAWVGLSATEPMPKLDNTTDDKSYDLEDYHWSDGTTYNDDDFRPDASADTDEDCVGISGWNTDDTMNTFDTYECDDPKMREALCSSVGWSPNEYRTFHVNFLQEINEISMVALSIDDEQTDNICIDEAVLLSETLYNPKYERAWFAQNWIGNVETCAQCEEGTFAFFKDPVCEMEIVDITFDMENMEVLETDETIAGFDCENHNRFAQSECTVDQSVSYTEETSTSVAYSKESSYTTSSSYMFHESVAVSTETKNEVNIPGFKTQMKVGTEWTFGSEQTETEEKTESYTDTNEDGYTKSTEYSISCAASIVVGKGIAQSYSLRFGQSNVTIPTIQDLKLTLCTEYFPNNAEDAVHIKYIDNVPGSWVYTTTTSCKVEFTAPYRLRNDYACNVEQGLAFLEQVIWVPLCNKDNPALYDGCQCVTGDKLTESACSCTDVHGNPAEDGQAVIVDAVFGWENTCRVLNCPDSIYTGQEVVMDAETETNTESGNVMVSPARAHVRDYNNNNNDIALSIGFVGVVLVLGMIGSALILKGSSCDRRVPSHKHDFDYNYKKTPIDSDSEFEEVDDVI